MVNSRSIRQLTSLVAAVAVVGAIGVLPAAAVGDPVVTTTTLWLDNPDREYGETVTGGVTVDAILGVDDVLTGRVALLVDDVEVQEWAIVDQPLTFELDAWSLPGEHTVTAVFESDDDFVTSSDDADFTVAIVPSSITLVDTSDLVFGEAGTIRFDLEAALAPTGEVTLTDGGAVIATGAVEVDPETPGFGTVTLELPAALKPGRTPSCSPTQVTTTWPRPRAGRSSSL